MANIRDIRRRIRSAKNIQQITRAMKFVSAARLRRAQDRVIAARPYAKQMFAVLNSLAARVPEQAHPLLARRGEERIELVIITADRGLCGAYNTNIIRQALECLVQHSDRRVELNILGKRGRDFFRRRRYAVRHEAVGVLQKPTFADAAAIARDLIEEFVSGRKDQIWLVYNEFKSVVQQRVVIELYAGRLTGAPRASAEIAELVWFAENDDWGQLAPSLAEAIFPDLVRRGRLPWARRAHRA